MQNQNPAVHKVQYQQYIAAIQEIATQQKHKTHHDIEFLKISQMIHFKTPDMNYIYWVQK